MAAPRKVPDAAAYGLPAHVACPFCERDRTELHSPFGPQLSVATYWCHDCRTAFDYVKWSSRPGPA
jgi:transposase-like protein